MKKASRKRDIIRHFDGDNRGVRKTAEAFGISTQAVYLWPDKVPIRIAVQVANMTDGELKFDRRDYP